MHLYEVEFPGWEITELAANIIEKSLCAQHNVDNNEYLLLDSAVDHRNDDSALGLEDQKVVVNGKATIRMSTACWDRRW